MAKKKIVVDGKNVKAKIVFGFNEYEFIDELQKALKSFGIYMYDDPLQEGSTEFGCIISDTKLNEKQVKKVSMVEQPEVWKSIK